MTPRRPKDVGTWTETQILRACQRAGITGHRCALAGSSDLGDLHLLGGRIVVEAKGGEQTRKPSWNQIHAWMRETETEAANVVTCDLGLLVIRRWGSGDAADWHAWTNLADLAALTGTSTIALPSVPVSLRLGDLLALVTPSPAHPETPMTRRAEPGQATQ